MKSLSSTTRESFLLVVALLAADVGEVYAIDHKNLEENGGRCVWRTPIELPRGEWDRSFFTTGFSFGF